MLVAPLDWGLGHATRCIPIITTLIARGCEVIIAAEGQQKKLLEAEFPSLEFLHLPGYQVRYGRFALSTFFKIIGQIPRILLAVRQEKRWLKELLKQQHISLVISDNRYGLHNKKLPSVFITHQLLIKTGVGKLADKILQKVNYQMIRHFNYCWIPDYEDGRGLAGVLSHPNKLPDTRCSYIGVLSRFQSFSAPAVEKHLLVILSGPEPQRTILEDLLISQLAGYQKPVVILRGLPSAEKLPAVAGDQLTVYNHLPAKKMAEVISEAETVICRSGYSSIMDLIPLGKKCVFIPTPGQPEQTYLAYYLASKKYCLSYPQHRFSISQMLHDLKSFQTIKPDSADVSLAERLEATLSCIIANG